LSERKCAFYASTWLGARCVLASPEEWRMLRQNGRKPPCLGGSDPCPFIHRRGGWK